MTDPPGYCSVLIESESVDEPNQERLIKQISANRFASWYYRKKWRENIENGQPYFNGSGKVPKPERHTPSKLLQCHRKITYRQLNAPEEQSEPQGIFWFGTKFEEELVLPFLQESVTDGNTFVSNSLWVDYTLDTSAGELRIKGSTDPVIVDTNGIPILPTEIKTKSSVENVDEPNDHHLAQLHAYLVGLNEKYDRDLTRGVLIYGARESLDIIAFDVAFDSDFWDDTVLEWASTHTQYRLNESLPPAEPEYDWECRFCEYQHRCGQGSSDHSDYGPRGFLPKFTAYPRKKVIEYLEARPDESLTPALAREYPDLAEVYEVMDWYCSTCGSSIDWKIVDNAEEPLCPRCAERDELSPLSLLTVDGWPSPDDISSETTQ